VRRWDWPLPTLKLTFLEQWGEAGAEVRAHSLETASPAEKEKLPTFSC